VRVTPAKGAVVIHVRKVAMVMEEGQQPSDYVIVSIFNSGPGLTSDDLVMLFDRYRNSSGDGSEQRTNLGLIICQRIIEAHNGKIWAESEFGKGATFFFVLPIR
jgi:signal transduction histidine kinase